MDGYGGIEAVISGNGRNAFSITYFATDYAQNKQVYQTQKNVDVTLSGILLVLDENENEEKISVDGLEFSEDFSGYMPHKELAEFGCFDFIGILEDYREINLLEDKSVSGYIMKIRLITNEEIKDFFTIPMFVNKENMRFEKIKKGMRLTGMFQLLGEHLK